MKNREYIKLCIVLSVFDRKISDALLAGSIKKFIESGGLKENVTFFEVPGAFEIPGAVSMILKKSHDYDAIISLGCVVKGDTAHFEYISSSVTDSLSKISISDECSIPIIYGILTTYDYEQAIERSDPNKKDKGGEVMSSALDAIDTYQKINNK
jgi:6,7-dimethyl-8-ribityllumazine synthase